MFRERLLLSVSTFLIIFLLCLISPTNANADNADASLKSQNYFYVNAINNALASIKSLSNGTKAANGEDEYTTLSFLGIDIFNPTSILSKEIAYLNNTSIDNESNGVEERTTLTLNPFKLDDNQVSKSDTLM